MSLTGAERVPLLDKGLSISLTDTATADDDVRVPLLNGYPSCAANLLWAQPSNVRIPLVSGGASVSPVDMAQFQVATRATHATMAGVGAMAAVSI